MRGAAPVLLAVVAAVLLAFGLTLGLPDHPLPIVAGFAGLAYLYTLIRHPRVGLHLAVLSNVLDQVFLVDLPGLHLSGRDLGILLFACVMAGRRLFVDRHAFQHRNVLPLAVFVGVCALSLLVSRNLGNSIPFLLRVALVVVFCIQVVDMTRTLAQVRALMVSFLLCTLGLSLFAIPELGNVGGRVFSRIGGGTSEPNVLATYIGIGLIPLGYFFRRSRAGLARLGLGAAALFLVTVLLLTYSRGGWIASLVGIVVWALLSRVRPIYIVAVALVGLGALVFSDTLFHILQARPFGDESTLNRAATYRMGLRVLLDNPLLGIGLDQFGELYSQQWVPLRVVRRSPHNVYLQIGAETGVFGLLTFLWFCGSSFFKLVRARIRTVPGGDRRLLVWAVFSMGFCLLLSQATGSNLSSGFFWVVFALVLSLAAILDRLPVEAAESTALEAPSPEVGSAAELRPSTPSPTSVDGDTNGAVPQVAGAARIDPGAVTS